MPTYIKTGTPSTAWSQAKRIYIKTGTPSTAWSTVKYAWIRTANGWEQIHTNAFTLNSSTNITGYPWIIPGQLKFNLKTYLTNAGWNATDDLDVTLQVPAGSNIYSDSPSNAAFAFPHPTVLPPFSSIVVNVYGKIVGAGGNGGTGGGAISPGASSSGENGGNAIRADTPITFNKYPGGIIAGGGGGGGGGAGSNITFSMLGAKTVQNTFRLSAAGGGGGGGQSYGGSPQGGGAGGAKGQYVAESPTPVVHNVGPKIRSPIPSGGLGPPYVLAVPIHPGAPSTGYALYGTYYGQWTASNGSDATTPAAGAGGSGGTVTRYWYIPDPQVTNNWTSGYWRLCVTGKNGGAGGALGNGGSAGGSIPAPIHPITYWQGSPAVTTSPNLFPATASGTNGVIAQSPGGSAGLVSGPSAPHVTINTL